MMFHISVGWEAIELW